MKETTRHIEAFELWYASACNWSKTAQKSAISRRLLYEWADKFNWLERATARDEKVAAVVDERAIAVRVARIEEQRQLGELIRTRSTEYFIDNKIDNAGVALSAARLGIDIERQADGLPSEILEILNADASTLKARIAEMDARRRAAIGADAGTVGSVGAEAENDQVAP